MKSKAAVRRDGKSTSADAIARYQSRANHYFSVKHGSVQNIHLRNVSVIEKCFKIRAPEVQTIDCHPLGAFVVSVPVSFTHFS